MKIIDPSTISVPEMHGYLLGAVIPRPIAFATTIDGEGNVNLSPFSFFNCFGANPPILVFSPARRGRDNTTKHTYENVKDVPEVVISIVNYNIVEQMSLSSTEYPQGVDEYVKAGLTPIPSERVAPPRVKESPVSFECKVIEVKPLGNEGGAGNLVICEVLLMHITEEVLNEKGKIDPYKLDAVARLGGNFYSRVTPESIFEIAKPLAKLGIGIDNLPEEIRVSTVLTGNDLARLANVEAIPVIPDEVQEEVRLLLADKRDVANSRHILARDFLDTGELVRAWACLLTDK